MNRPRETGWLAEYPVTDIYQLSSGRAVEVPYKCYEAQALYIYGFVDINALNSLLVDQNYTPVRFGDSLGVAALTPIDYRDTSCGSYRELLWSFLTSKQPLALPNDGTPMTLLAATSHPDAVMMSYKLYLDQQHAIDVGREIYGFPKHRTPQQVEASVDGQHFHFKLVCDGRLAVRGRVQLPGQVSPKSRNKMLTVTSKEVVQTRIAFDVEAGIGVRSIDTEDDFFASPESEFGRQLLELCFQPKLAVFMPGAELVMHKPLNWHKPVS